MAKVDIGLDAELVVEVTVLAGVGSTQDPVEALVRHHDARGHRTGARVRRRDETLRGTDGAPPLPEG
ncbi:MULTISPECIES: DUF2191 domain-containing protein [unclassified Streptomyces]|uniref:DUF2191 domain-containing protein n=1 Tax=unclassified Streptomyces TaxID=2593676 RepID=UPI002E2C90F4|nr:DUF2191 domain-containing protein [Streptomyces sp. NBC_01439]